MRVLATLVCAAVAWTPWALVWGDAIGEAARAGQDAGLNARNALALPSRDGNTIVMPGGTGGNLSFETLFPDAHGGDPATFSQWYGNASAVVGNGRDAQQNLMTEQTPNGSAYRTLRGAVDRDRPDRRNDPLWSQTDFVLDHFNDLAKTFSDCSTVTTFENGTRKAHVEDLRTCEVVAKSGDCSWYHDYRLPPSSAFVTARGGATVAECGSGCATVTYTHGLSLVWYGKAYPTAFEAPQTFGFDVADKTRVTAVHVTIAMENPAIVFETPRPPDWLLRADHFYYHSEASFPGYSYSYTSPTDIDWGVAPGRN